MFTKKLMHDIITFCNNYVDNDNIVISVDKYPNFIVIDFGVWKLSNEKRIDIFIGRIDKSIHNEEEFIKYKQQVLEELPKLLELLK